MSELAAERIISYIKQNPTATICLAGGYTPIGTYQIFSQKAKESKLDLTGITFVGLDEWVGLNGADKGSCRETLDEYIFRPLHVREDHILFFDGKAANSDKECSRVVEELEQKGGLDFALLGIGLNGHVGFNEPHVPMEQKAHVVTLDDVTRDVSSKYFKEVIKVSQGMTLGMKTILSSDQIVLLASGAEKAEIIAQAVNEKPSPEIPASLLSLNKNFEIILDSEAGRYVESSR